MIRSSINTIALNRVDNLGDAVLLLPAAGILKHHYPECRLLFLGQGYQQAVIESCVHFDGFLDWDEVKHERPEKQVAFLTDHHIDVIVHVRPRRVIATAAKRARIPHRIGSSDRVFHLFTCNHLPFQLRRRSKLHEAQLNIHLLAPFLDKVDYTVEELEPFVGFDRIKQYPELAERYLSTDRFNLILHPSSHGHAKDWHPRNFAKLVELLPPDRYNILVTGTQSERDALSKTLLEPCQSLIQDLTGQLTLSELVSLISAADGLVAASTGPLHIAAAAGIHALGLYVQKPQFRPSRYGPIGKRSTALVYDENCPICLADQDCDCIDRITPERVLAKMAGWTRL